MKRQVCSTAILSTILPLLASIQLAAVPALAQQPAQQPAQPPAQQLPQLTAREAVELGTDAYVYGYPLVTMEMTRRVMTNVEKVEGTRGPMGQLIRMRAYPTAAFRDITAPNADTLYTTAWIDVGKEPWILSLPDVKGRYYLMPLLDAWTNVFQDPGLRTTGTGPQTYAITGPGWKGKLPAAVMEYKSPTAMVWLMGRIYCTGTQKDYKAVHELQDKISLYPLSAYGRPYTPPLGKVDPSIDMTTAVRDQVNALSAPEYFTLLAKLMKDNPPTAADAPMVAKLAKLGMIGDRATGMLGAEAAKALQAVPKPALDKIRAQFGHAGTIQNGWMFTTKTGLYGTDYLQRAALAFFGLGANRPEDAVYPTSAVDAEGRPYDGANRYVMHFDPGQLPPVNGFWSLTLYNADYFFVNNPLNRYTLSQLNKLKANPDGSVDLYLQKDNPGKDKESNWLPAPTGRFILMLRLYWPKEKPPSIMDGSWKIPPVTRVGASK